MTLKKCIDKKNNCILGRLPLNNDFIVEMSEVVLCFQKHNSQRVLAFRLVTDYQN